MRTMPSEARYFGRDPRRIGPISATVRTLRWCIAALMAYTAVRGLLMGMPSLTFTIGTMAVLLWVRARTHRARVQGAQWIAFDGDRLWWWERRDWQGPVALSALVSLDVRRVAMYQFATLRDHYVIEMRFDNPMPLPTITHSGIPVSTDAQRAPVRLDLSASGFFDFVPFLMTHLGAHVDVTDRAQQCLAIQRPAY